MKNVCQLGAILSVGTAAVVPWAVLLCQAPTGAAQRQPSEPVSAPTMTIGRLHYDGGGDWYANPSSLPNLLQAIQKRTNLPVVATEVVVTLADDGLWSVPYLHMTGHGNVRFSDEDLATLRQWLLQGGFLHASDNYGMDASFRREMKRCSPSTT